MVTLWYPARCPTHGRARAPWLPPEAAALYKQKVSQQLHTSLDTVDLPLTHAYTNAAVEEYGHGLPVVLFSPGYRAQRALGAALVEDLASRGHAVVTIDHTHESDIVEFPGGRLEPGRQPGRPTDEDIAKALRVRQDDTRFVPDELAGLNAGRNPDAEGRPLPHGLCGALGLRRTGMFGHSLGGDTAAEVMAADHRVMAGADLDGSINGSVAATGLDRPFLLMSNASHGRENDPSWEEFWSHLRGWRRSLRLRASGPDLHGPVPADATAGHGGPAPARGGRRHDRCHRHDHRGPRRSRRAGLSGRLLRPSPVVPGPGQASPVRSVPALPRDRVRALTDRR
ncbi:lipase [Streptomyces longhuiensis]|uniref:alpha/beta hydrolase n=1 Tax=Streptomyces longhuiensis TaxID=2880933 RepID=UPI001D0B6FBD|nr:lipase [Streptomyces longhuiensis]UDL97998.1 lipase [Streptomyces longhuiensis]